MENFYDLLFEVSNDYRHEMLLLLLDNPMRVTDISKKMDLTSQEISRHVARLGEAGLTYKDTEGFHHVSNYGSLVISLLEELEFAALNREYFKGHNLTGIPLKFIKRIGDLKDSTYTENVITFIQGVEKLIKEANQYVFFIADQFPLSSLGFINEALDRGVRFKSIEKKDGFSGLHSVDSDYMENRAKGTPLIEYRVVESIDLILFVSEKDAVISFQTSGNGFDYQGFITNKAPSINWGRELFEYFWQKAKPRSSIVDLSKKSTPSEVLHITNRGESIIVEGRDDHRVDPFAVQDAVDNFGEVILRGVFNFDNSTVTIRKDVHIRGEGRKDDIPSTIVSRKHWSFPSAIVNQLFLIEGADIEVTIENLHFTDFFAYCIFGCKGRRANIKNNRITLETGFYRGITNISFGDAIIGFLFIDDFPGGVVIENNYVEYATNHLYGGYILLDSMKGLDGKPDCINHKYFSSYCVYVRDVPGEIIVRNNTFRNMTARAISVCGTKESAEVIVSGNQIFSDVHGSYVMDNRWAGIGIAAHCSWREPSPGFKLKVEKNNIQFSKPGHCGIALLGPLLSPKGSGKLSDGFVRDNVIEMKEGAIGILVESCDGFDIERNTLLGSMHYGIGLFPRFDPDRSIMGAFGNMVTDNKLEALEIISTTQSNRDMFSGKAYEGSRANAETSHIWLNLNTGDNRVKTCAGISVVDEGNGNKIQVSTRQDA